MPSDLLINRKADWLKTSLQLHEPCLHACGCLVFIYIISRLHELLIIDIFFVYLYNQTLIQKISMEGG